MAYFRSPYQILKALLLEFNIMELKTCLKLVIANPIEGIYKNTHMLFINCISYLSIAYLTYHKTLSFRIVVTGIWFGVVIGM